MIGKYLRIRIWTRKPRLPEIRLVDSNKHFLYAPFAERYVERIASSTSIQRPVRQPERTFETKPRLSTKLESLPETFILIDGMTTMKSKFLFAFFALVNSFGVLEIARAEGSAADGLGVERSAPVTVSNQA